MSRFLTPRSPLSYYLVGSLETTKHLIPHETFCSLGFCLLHFPNLFFYPYRSVLLILPIGSGSTILYMWMFLRVSSLDSQMVLFDKTVWMNLPTPWLLIYWWYLSLISVQNSDLYFNFLWDIFTEHLLYTWHGSRCYYYIMEQNTKGPM